MTNRKALIALRDAVADCWFPADVSASNLGLAVIADETGFPVIRKMYDAFAGSVDAAIALLEAVLPRASFWVETKIDGIHHAGVFVPNLGRTFQAEAPNLGRALLIATLNALIAESN